MRWQWVFGAVIGAFLMAPVSAIAGLVDGPDIIGPPASVIDDPPGAVNANQQAFDEAQQVLLIEDLQVDGGVVGAGTVVSSHMIFLNTLGFTEVIEEGTVWTFDGPVLGVMSDQGGLLEEASNGLLGAAGTEYPGAFGGRGFEPDTIDAYEVDGSTIVISMQVTEPGDWIRVVTEAPTCEPSNPDGVRGQGFWKRQCRGPHPSGEYGMLGEYVDYVMGFETFAEVGGADDLCAVLYPDVRNDKCRKAEAQFIGVLLNLASGRLAACQCLDANMLDAPTVGDAVAVMDEILSAPDRTGPECGVVQHVADALNSGYLITDCP